MREGMSYGGLPFSGTGCHVPDVYVHYVVWNEISNDWDTISTLIHLPKMIFFLNTGLNDIQWASFIAYLHTKLYCFYSEIIFCLY